MTDPTLDAFVSAVETWQHARRVEAEAFTLRGFRGFVEVMNFHTRRLISISGKQDPEFWSALAELSTHAQTITTKGAKLFADGQDRTNT